MFINSFRKTVHFEYLSAKILTMGAAVLYSALPVHAVVGSLCSLCCRLPLRLPDCGDWRVLLCCQGESGVRQTPASRD